jgi:predicted DNA-binding WGR domain protein
MEWIQENGWEVLNGNKQGNEEGEWTYIGSRGEIVIDYGIVNEEAWERVEEFKVGERAESDHLEIALRKRRGGKEQRRKGMGDRNETVDFFGIAVLCLKKM